MGEVAGIVGRYVTAYSGDLADESLEGQRVVVAGIVVGKRTVITKARATMAIVTLEDLQGSLEVVVFPRTWEETSRLWTEGAILLVAGRIDHRGDEVSLLADLVVEWEPAMAAGPEAFARQVAATRSRPGRPAERSVGRVAQRGNGTQRWQRGAAGSAGVRLRSRSWTTGRTMRTAAVPGAGRRGSRTPARDAGRRRQRCSARPVRVASPSRGAPRPWRRLRRTPAMASPSGSSRPSRCPRTANRRG